MKPKMKLNANYIIPAFLACLCFWIGVIIGILRLF
jgi:hypothetical protein